MHLLKYSSRKRFCLPGKFIVFFKIGPVWPLSPSIKLYVMTEKKKLQSLFILIYQAN